MAIYRGAKCPTLKTAGKQPKRCRVGHGKTAERQPGVKTVKSQGGKDREWGQTGTQLDILEQFGKRPRLEFTAILLSSTPGKDKVGKAIRTSFWTQALKGNVHYNRKDGPRTELEPETGTVTNGGLRSGLNSWQPAFLASQNKRSTWTV